MVKKIDKIAEEIIDKLKKENIVIHRYDSSSTNSIYLKLDYGMSYSIRISDHKGKKHLQFRYNLLTNIKKTRIKRKGKYERRFYNVKDIDLLINDIKKERRKKLIRYGKERYKKHMFVRRKSAKKDNGFWLNAEHV